jgi:hypothetical protein
MVVIAGVSSSHMSVSQTSMMSAFSSGAAASRKAGRLGLPDSSSPSSRTETRIGNLPATAFQALQASRKVNSAPLSSDAPRATMCVSPSGCGTSTGSNGSEFHRLSGSTGCTS